MAFVLVGVFIFFALVGLVYVSVRMAVLKGDSGDLKESDALENVRMIYSSPEFIWQAFDCEGCVDLDKAMVLKGRKIYSNFWGLDYLALKRIYPQGRDIECSEVNYPDCSTITIINKTTNVGAVYGAFVALCRWDESGRTRCEIGKVYSSGRGI